MGKRWIEDVRESTALRGQDRDGHIERDARTSLPAQQRSRVGRPASRPALAANPRSGTVAQVTAPGVTTVAPHGNTSPALPGQLRGEFVSTRFEPLEVGLGIATTASCAPPVRICGTIDLSADEIELASVHVLHYETVPGVGGWVDLPVSTTWLPSGLVEVCAEWNGFSPVVVAFSGPDTDGFVLRGRRGSSAARRAR